MMQMRTQPSNQAQLCRQIVCNALKRGIQTTRIKSVYSSPECSTGYSTEQADRPDQETSSSDLSFLICHYLRYISLCIMKYGEMF